MGRGEDQLGLQLCQLPPQLLDVLGLAPAAGAAPPLLLLLGLEDGVPEARRRRLQRHEAGGPRLLGLAAGLLHDQDLGQEEILKVLYQ